MPIIQSAKKSLRKNDKRKLRNLKQKNKMKELLKKFQLLISEKKIEEAKSLLPQIQKSLDKAAKKNIIKKNTASRRKSRLTKKVNKEEKIK
jgi:small subunit ribosomal protein S20